jgi:Ca2+/H+ antiporter
VSIHSEQFVLAGIPLTGYSGLGLAVPTAFYVAVNNSGLTDGLDDKVISLSRVAAIFLLIAYLIYIWFQARSHHGIYDAILEGDEQKDHDRHEDLKKAKLTFTECVLALGVSIALVGCYFSNPSYFKCLSSYFCSRGVSRVRN